MAYIFDEVVTTLYEGHYNFGVASLINSLAKSSFQGLVYVGYKGELPCWIDQLTVKDNYYQLKDNLLIEFAKIDTDLHFGYYKPFCLQAVFNKYPLVIKAFYFDPDIVINASWSFFTQWVECGVALCLDSNFSYLHHNHPWRNSWISLANKTGDYQINKIDFYVNSGFVGIHRRDSAVIDRWCDLTQTFQKIGGNVRAFEKEGTKACKTDQDLLNAAITISPDISFSIVGMEGMGFTHMAFLMLHAIESVKPWKKNSIREAFKGRPPSLAEKGYWLHANTYLKLYPNWQIRKKKLSMQMASLLTRFYKK